MRERMNVNELDTFTQERGGAGAQQIKKEVNGVSKVPDTRTKACTYVQKRH